MTRATPPEWRALSLLAASLGKERSAGIELGIGDDCAVLAPSRSRLVWTNDACLEGVHFRFDWSTPADVAWKSLNAATSDVAAMGALPLGALCHLTLGPTLDEPKLRAFARAQARAARALGCPIVGGNLAHGDSFQVVLTVLGKMKSPGTKPLLRNGAKPGDELWLVGELGLAGLGLRILQGRQAPRGQLARRCLSSFRRPQAHVNEGPRLLGRATSCIDISDGLSGDAAHVARASQVRLVFDAEQLLAQAPPGFEVLCQTLGVTPLDALLSGGEDYALLASGQSAKRPRFARLVGRVEAGRGVFVEQGGRRRPLSGGYEHGRRSEPSQTSRRSRAGS